MTAIYTLVPFAEDRNFGRACNEAMALLPDGAWGAILDHDASFTTREWYAQLREAVELQPRAMFTGVTNRIARPWQRAQEADPNNHDMAYHRRIGTARLARRTLLGVTHTRGIGGVLMVVSKEAWREVGGFAEALYCVDHQMHFAHANAGRRVFVLESLYLYHWRRADGATVVETPKAACDCLKRRGEPSARISLP